MEKTSQEPYFADPGFKIGPLDIPTRVLMAPMMGYNEPPLRRITKRLGSGFCTTEMIKPEQLDRPNKSLLKELTLSADEHPAAAQISGREPAAAVRAALQLRDMGYDMIDVNFGCPLKKECSKGRGAAMMREPILIGRLVKALVKALDCPVTVKMRSGWADDEETAPQAARLAADNGAAAVCVHGRSKLGWYSTPNDHSVIRRTREAVPELPFIANGDVVDVASARQLLDNTGADALMIGRGSVGNPWIFQRIHSNLAFGKNIPAPDYAVIRAVYDEHVSGLFDCFKRKTAMRFSRKYAFFYFARYIDPDFRKRIAKSRQLETLMALIDELADVVPSATESPLRALKE